MDFQTNDGFIFHESLLSSGIDAFKNIIKSTCCQIYPGLFFPFDPQKRMEVEKQIKKGMRVREVYLNVAKHFTIRAWVNRSERLRGEPFIQ
jgi:hypothetical protein